MSIEKEFNKFLYEWVKKNFGQSEADDPSWSIEALAHDLADEYWKIQEKVERENIKEDIEYVARSSDIELTEQELADITDDYRYSEAYCSMDAESIMYFIEKRKEERK